MLLVDAIKEFLRSNVADHLFPLYSEKMEVQVQAAQDNGEIESREFVTEDGRTVGFSVFKDGDDNEWKTYRIPYLDGNDEPSYNLEKKLTWDFDEHLEGIALSGWNWVDKQTHYVVFDFDSIVNHSEGLSEQELQAILDAVAQVPWVSIWRSTSGTGYHLAVAFTKKPRTVRRREHSAVAHAVLNLLSEVTGIELMGPVDCFGMLHWVWHRKSEEVKKAFNIIKLAKENLAEAPYGWREYITERTRKNRANIPTWVPDDEIELFEGARSGNPRTPLDFEHRKLLNWLIENKRQHWWDRENWLCVCHTADLRDAKQALKLRGIYETIATGKDAGDHNCFMHPTPNGSWAVRRFGTVTESPTWTVQNGYALCYFNREPEFVDALNHIGAAKVSARRYKLNATQLSELANLYKIDDFLVPFEDRGYNVTKGGKDKPVIKVKREAGDEQPGGGWSDDENKWVIVFDIEDPQKLVGEYVGDTIRAVINGEDGIKYYAWNAGDAQWYGMSRTNIADLCASLNMSDSEAKAYIGMLNRTAWKCDKRPFQPEYPGGKLWNRNRATFAYRITKSSSNYFPTYERILTHIGRDLDEPVKNCKICRSMGIKNGRDWLFCWLAIMFQKPEQKTHYLYLWSPDGETGKTTFYEVLSKLFKDGEGVFDVAQALKGDFNAELEGCVLGVIEETNLGNSGSIYDQVKKLTATETLCVHKKGATPFRRCNYLHFIHCTNSLTHAPIRDMDTRCVIIRVNKLSEHEYIDRSVLKQRLDEESSDFLSALLNFKLPKPYKRFWLPLPETNDRLQLLSVKENPCTKYVNEAVINTSGYALSFNEIYANFQEWCVDQQRPIATKQQLQIELLKRHPFGIYGKKRDMVGNIAIEEVESKDYELVLESGALTKRKIK